MVSHYSIGSCECHVIFGTGHVIPGDHLLPMSLSKGPSGVTFDFTYQTRDSSALVRVRQAGLNNNILQVMQVM